MRVRLWSVDARTRMVLGEIKHASGDFVSEIAGGSCNVTVRLDLLENANGTAVDIGMVETVLDLLKPGARAILATDERKRVLGEWLIRSRKGTSPEGGVQVQGVAWEILPSLRVVRDRVEYAAADQYIMARDLLNASYNQGQGATVVGMQSGVSGVLRNLVAPARSTYYGDLLEAISSPEGGFEWAIVTTTTWVQDAPRQVTRTAIMGMPRLDRGPTAVVFDQDVPGSRRGRAVSITGGVDWTRMAQQVTGSGGAEGGKSPQWGLDDPAPDASVLRTEKVVSYPSVLDMAHLQDLVRGELERSRSGASTYEAVGYVDRLNGWPVPAGIAWLYANATWVFPRGIDLFVRIGRVSWKLAPNGDVQTVAVVGMDGSDWTNPAGGG